MIPAGDGSQRFRAADRNHRKATSAALRQGAINPSYHLKGRIEMNEVGRALTPCPSSQSRISQALVSIRNHALFMLEAQVGILDLPSATALSRRGELQYCSCLTLLAIAIVARGHPLKGHYGCGGTREILLVFRCKASGINHDAMVVEGEFVTHKVLMLSR